ncbi:MAG TPA: hypothetical protein VII22_05560 [Streptosporangiaceae bacterium]
MVGWVAWAVARWVVGVLVGWVIWVVVGWAVGVVVRRVIRVLVRWVAWVVVGWIARAVVVGAALAWINGARCGRILKRRGDAGQRIQEQPDENLGPQHVDPAVGSGRLHGLSERRYPGHRGTSLDSGQVMPGNSGRPFLVGVEPDPGPPFRLLTPPFRCCRVNSYDRSAQRGTKLARRLLLCSLQNPFFDCPGVIITEHAGEFGDEPDPR